MTAISERAARPDAAAGLILAAWLLAFVASLAVLFIGEILGQRPCNLCWFQRTFMFPLAVILGIAAWRTDPDIWRYAVPLAAGGALVAAYHLALYAGLVPAPIVPCTASGPSCTDDGMLVLGMPLPALALATFTGIGLLLLPLRRMTT